MRLSAYATLAPPCIYYHKQMHGRRTASVWHLGGCRGDAPWGGWYGGGAPTPCTVAECHILFFFSRRAAGVLGSYLQRVDPQGRAFSWLEVGGYSPLQYRERAGAVCPSRPALAHGTLYMGTCQGPACHTARMPLSGPVCPTPWTR